MFDWLGELVGGLGNAVGDTFDSVGQSISESIWSTMLKWIYTSIYDAIASFFGKIGNMGIEIFELGWVQAMVHFFELLGWSLFIAGLVVAVFDTAIEYQSGRANIKSTFINVLKGFLACHLITTVPVELYKTSVTLQTVLMGDLTRAFANEQFSGLGEKGLSVLQTQFMLNGVVDPNIFSLFAMIAFGYCVVKIFFANIKRGGILLIQIAVGSLYMFSVPRGYSDGFTSWCKQIIALCLTAFMQTTLLFLGLITFANHMLLGLGIMLAANEVPKIAGQFGLDSSVRVNMSSVVHTSVSAVNLGKTVAKLAK